MKTDKISFICYFHSFLVLCCGGVVTQNVTPNLAVNKFQNNLQQQNFYTVLNSIEERLRNLDNIYSMQLSQTLESKLDQYNRKLESLDTKIIRLEALVMLNLDKISENISTKNFKDDISKTNTYRKMDSLYEGLSHRLSYMDRKYEMNFEKLQEKLDITMNHLNKMEENLATRGSDIEMELSDAIFAIDDLKNTYSNMEGKLFNISETAVNITKDNYDLIKRFNMDNKKAMNKLHDNIVGNLQYMDNKTSQHIKISQESTDILKQMKTELKEDFNNYANKVADMSSDIWKNTDTTEDDLYTIGTVINSTKVELQNGIRTLMLQIGKISNKGGDSNTSLDLGPDHYNELDKKLTKNFAKILKNQEVFMDSCHRLQMDEAQIESEISVMLEKLIDMLEKKLASESKDIKSIEKALKTHDSRVNRNLHQANSNIISLFEKYTLNTQQMTGDVKQIESDINTLYAFVQTNLNTSRTTLDKNILEQLITISSATGAISRKQENNIESLRNTLLSLDGKIKNITSQCSQNSQKPDNKKNNKPIAVQELDSDTLKAIQEVFGPNTIGIPVNKTDEDTRKAVDNIFPSKHKNNTQNTIVQSQKNCSLNYGDLIDVRADIPVECKEIKKNKKRKKKNKSFRKLIDIRSGFGNDENDTEYEDYEETTTEETQTVTDPETAEETQSNSDPENGTIRYTKTLLNEPTSEAPYEATVK